MRRKIVSLILISMGILCTSCTQKNTDYAVSISKYSSALKSTESIDSKEYTNTLIPEDYVFSKAAIGDDITFHFETENHPDVFPTPLYYYLFNTDTKTKHKLKLPNCNHISGRDENTIIYSGGGKSYSANLNTLDSKVLCDFEFDPSLFNPYLKDTLHYLMDVSGDWVYYMNIDFYTEKMSLHRLSISTGDIVPFPFADILNTDEHLNSYSGSYIYDERGFVPQRGKAPLSVMYSFGQKWNGFLPTFSFGEKGLFHNGIHYGWDGESSSFDFTSLVFSEDTILAYNGYNDGSSTMSTFASELIPKDEISFQKKNFKPDIKYNRFSSFNGPHIIFPIKDMIKSRNYENALHFDTSKERTSLISEDTAVETLNTRENFFIHNKKLFSKEYRFIYDFSHYDNVTFENSTQHQGYYVNTGMYPDLRKSYTYINNYDYNDSKVFIKVYNDHFYYSTPFDLYFADEFNSIVCVQKDLRFFKNHLSSINIFRDGRIFYGKDSIIFPSSDSPESSREIRFHESFEDSSSFYLGMNYREALDVCRTKDIPLSKRTCGVRVFNQRIEPKYFTFLDYLLSFHVNPEDDYDDIDFFFDEKTEKLYNITLSSLDRTSRGVSIGDSFSEMTDLYGDDYTMVPRLRYHDDALIVDCEYKLEHTYVVFTYNFEDIKGIPDDLENVLSHDSKIHSIYLSLYGLTENTRYDNNEKYWIYLYGQCIDLSVELVPGILKMLSHEQLLLLKNAYYAKHGLIFKDKMYSDFYENHYWYRALYKDVDSMLTETDKYNINMIDNY